MLVLPASPELYNYSYSLTIEGVVCVFRWRWIAGEGWYWTLTIDGVALAHHRLSPNTVIRVTGGPSGVFLGYGAKDPYEREDHGVGLNLVYIPDAEIPTDSAPRDWAIVVV